MKGKQAASRVLSLRPPSGWPERRGPISWSLRTEAGRTEGACDSLADLPAQAKADEVQFWSPSAATLLLETKLPPMSRSRAVKALPFSLEERLIDDPVSLHFARKELHGGLIVVGVTKTALMTAWLEALHAARLTPTAVCPNVLSLPFKEGSWSLQRDGDYLLVRTSLLMGRAVPWAAEPPKLLTAALTEARAASRAPDRLLVVGVAGDFNCERWASALGLAVERGESSAALDAAPPLNLRQGAFAPSWQLPVLAARLAPGAIMLTLWAAGGIGVAGWRWRTLARVERRQIAEMADLLHQSFPEIKASKDPAGQMARQLEALRARGGRLSSGDLLPLLDGLARGLAAVPGLQLRAIEYGDAALEATVLTSDLASIEQLKQSCAGNGLNLEIASAVQSDGKTQARLRVLQGERHASH